MPIRRPHLDSGGRKDRGTLEKYKYMLSSANVVVESVVLIGTVYAPTVVSEGIKGNSNSNSNCESGN